MYVCEASGVTRELVLSTLHIPRCVACGRPLLEVALLLFKSMLACAIPASPSKYNPQ